jgi:glycosyltransferase involved in cell wall biosynthesis
MVVAPSSHERVAGIAAETSIIHMDVSVVVPTRNRSALLAMTLRSVLHQQNVELEVIVVDEASTDDTPAMLAALGDARVRVIRHETPRGVSAARNRGAAEARGEWLAFLDDDDLWAPDKLARQLQAAQAVGRDWAYTGSVNITNHCRVVHGRPPLSPEEVMAALPGYNAIPGGGSNVAVRRATWLRAGPFDTRLRNTEDWEMWIRLAKHGPPACVSSPLLAYRVHSSNSSLDIGEIVRGTKLIEALHHTVADWGRLHRWLAESCLRRRQRKSALGHFIRAAVRGQARGVASDLGAILWRRVVQRILRFEGERTVSGDAWIAAAAAWLLEFEGCDHGSPEPTRTSAELAGPTFHG